MKPCLLVRSQFLILMKPKFGMKLFIFISFFLYHLLSYGQTITQDTLQARQYFEFGDSILESRTDYLISIYAFSQAAEIYGRHKLVPYAILSLYKIAEGYWRFEMFAESRLLLSSIHYALFLNGKIALETAKEYHERALDQILIDVDKNHLDAAWYYRILGQLYVS